ncbi:hypothetical protein [Dokdonella sp.]|uniref:hypothetical protein n=1 Tax=Dokdonella sp. TaxID=2291710 RepID=UPI001B077FBA|nr:hypothetical protein [Dokdonella sp.]MBO9663457.1 hypothetical protein [Dokdonella sp.]
MNTPRRPDQDLERLLADDGGEFGALYRRLPRAEPPRRLDRSVLAEAARAVHGTRPRRQRWLVGFGSAAGLVLAAGVAWHVGHEALRQQSPEAVHGTPSYVPVKPIEAPARRHESKPAADAASAPAAEAPAAAPASANVAAETETHAAKPAVEKAAPSQRRAPAPAPAAPPAAPVAAPEPQPMLQSAPAPAAEAEKREAFGAADSTAASAGESAALSKQAAETVPKRERATGTPALSSSAELRRDMQLAPELWLARIQQLVKQGRRQQAIKSLQLFRRAHPDWQLPDELRALDR